MFPLLGVISGGIAPIATYPRKSSHWCPSEDWNMVELLLKLPIPVVVPNHGAPAKVTEENIG